LNDRELYISQRARLIRERVLHNPYIPWTPHPKQADFLSRMEEEVMYGGAAGGGKTVSLLASALMFVDFGDYHALLLRRTFPQLRLPGSLIPLSNAWLRGTDARFNKSEHQWTFPSGSTLTFGHINTYEDVYDYQSSAYSFIGFDELTQFTRSMYTYLFSRVRSSSSSLVPQRIRSATNPGGVGHAWVKARFIDKKRTRDDVDEPTTSFEPWFIPALLEDNHSIGREQYERMLRKLSATDYMRLRHGDWSVMDTAGVFDPQSLLLLKEKMEQALRVRGLRTGAVAWDANISPADWLKDKPQWEIAA
jgi:hypothetical protein